MPDCRKQEKLENGEVVANLIDEVRVLVCVAMDSGARRVGDSFSLAEWLRSSALSIGLRVVDGGRRRCCGFRRMGRTTLWCSSGLKEVDELQGVDELRCRVLPLRNYRQI